MISSLLDGQTQNTLNGREILAADHYPSTNALLAVFLVIYPGQAFISLL